MPALREPLTDDDLYDWERMTSALAATEPWFVPGEQHAYHTNTYGHLVGEIVRRVGGSMPGDALRAVAAPLDADVWFGVPLAEQHRCAEVIWAPKAPIPTFDPARDAGQLSGDLLLNAMAHFNPPGYSSIGVMNTPEWRLAQIGSTSGQGSATGLARIYAALAEPDRLLSSGPAGRSDERAGVGTLPDPGRGLHLRPRVHPHDRRAPARARTRAASATSGPAARWASPTPTRGSASAT